MSKNNSETFMCKKKDVTFLSGRTQHTRAITYRYVCCDVYKIYFDISADAYK